MRDLVSSICKGAKVIPVVVIENVEDAVPLARCLVDNGLPAVEVTLRTPAALDAIKAIVNEVKDCVVGVGSILCEEQLKASIDAGAHFGVSPGTSATLLSALKATEWPFLPGSGTISEMMTLREAGFTELKMFPANIVGGVGMLKAVAGPVGDISFCPTGGVKPENAEEFLSQKNCFAVGGTWIAPLADVNAKNWDVIAERAKAASTLGKA
ncbi:bifunctional 4-hydroxy-2-oxoglutarate aldolase/2-dehydro-3-deoxy-phosphogluconate aldolase [uncultured Cohaesibacter sp.]|uniref:bifunctional 4-hydroxy-2-oxoglutarate aldolase/2-dehydro-3-deoxy-phosphogluconate aldolase n=1 Tax=uncultured Cohaesibacter sp. TaxID=1002546 RepID=UPI0029C86A3D|nr:bifunctional 4-hydroxy-2-oxoglutarate aldolase/2-dehydro-3-deoxy-phosphogluconate aldolase [uncultured Cohaesibacter sp.]